MDKQVPVDPNAVAPDVEREGARPAAIVMTHGHFDHVGALASLAERWDVPIYAHPLELPYLDGRSSYPRPDPSVGGGMMSAMSRFYPRGPVDVGRWLRTLPEDGAVPGMPGWRWIHTPGHTPWWRPIAVTEGAPFERRKRTSLGCRLRPDRWN